MTTFQYEGLTFSPLKKLRGKAADFGAISKKINDSKLTPTNWNYKEFYNAAKSVNAGEVDLFEMDGKIVIPAENYLFEYRQ